MSAVLPIVALIALALVFVAGLLARTHLLSLAAVALAAFPAADLADVEPEIGLAVALAIGLGCGLASGSYALAAILAAALVALALSEWLPVAVTSVFVFALLVGALKGRWLLSALALAAAVALGFVSEAAVGTIDAGAAPFGDAWIVVLILVASWLPALAAAAGEAREGSLWARSGRPSWPTPLPEIAANFVWVFAIILLGVLFDGAGIAGGDVFSAIFAGLLAAVLLFNLGAARTQAA